MKILVSAYSFYPNIGGIEEVTDLLAREFVARGHIVKIATMTPSAEADRAPFEILRRPGPVALLSAVRWCDVYLQEHLSLRLAWPLLLVRRPWVIALQTNLGLEGGWRPQLKVSALRHSDGVIACSRALAEQVYAEAVVIHNPYRESEFRRTNRGPRPVDLVFLGRLVSDKGVSLLIDALGRLRERGRAPSLAIIGGGPEEPALRAQCETLGVTAQVEFMGFLRGRVLVDRLNQCRVMVVPSIWDEPYGIVALEGIACGCAVVAARVGGLPEAVGPCGLTFPKGDPAALAAVIAELLGDESRIAELRTRAAEHVAEHRLTSVADAYLDILERARAGKTRARQAAPVT